MVHPFRRLALLVALVAASASACSSDGSGGGGDGPEVDAAAERIVAADASITTDEARCIVEKMTADGSIGLGEVSTMDVADLADNPDRLQDAYEAGLVTCT